MINSIAQNLQFLTEKLSKTNTKLIAVTKTKPVETIMKAYEAGFKRYGENKVQELVEKYEALPKDIEWHMIGHLQTNKVKYIAPFVHFIHGVDSLKLLEEINKQALKSERIIPVFLQIYIAKEETKFGFSKEEIVELLASNQFKSLKNIVVVGLMGMASNTLDNEQVRSEFKNLKTFFETLKSTTFANDFKFTELSMGMSGDFEIAAEEGSTYARIGSAIFGERKYLN